MTGEIRSLNSLRGIAALVVVVAHFSGATGWLGGLPGLGAGQIGVMLFFVLSGFLMSYLYFDRDFTGASLRSYVVARFARVVPLFAAILLVSIIAPRIGVTGVFFDLPTRTQIASHVLLLSGKNILWTIPTEIHFYVAFVGFWWLASKRKGVGIGAAAVAIAVVIALGFPRFQGETIRAIPYDLRLGQVSPYFLAGVVIAAAYKKWPPPTSRQSSWWSLVLLAIPLMYPLVFEELFGFRHRLWNDAFVLLAISAIFAVILFGVPATSGVLANRLGDYLGRISYSLYLLHVPVMWVVRKIDLPDTIRFVLFLFASIGVATLTFEFFERPVGRTIRRRAAGRKEEVTPRLPARL